MKIEKSKTGVCSQIERAYPTALIAYSQHPSAQSAVAPLLAVYYHTVTHIMPFDGIRSSVA